tara:strand:+ start:121 stop:852 length:732 start_codon:yes stop_codon:yes gene_type:complete
MIKKNLYIVALILIPCYCLAQCPDKMAKYHIEQAEKNPTSRNQLLAQYYTKICPCTNGSESPNILKDEINELIDEINETAGLRSPMPKVVRCVDNNNIEPKNYIEWQGKKEFFNEVSYSGNIDSTFPQQMHLRNSDENGNLIQQGKKFQYIRISGFKLLDDGESISLGNTNEILHVGIIDLENDFYYYTAKSATLKGLGGNMYELITDFHLTGSAGNNFQNNPEYPPYELKAFFVFNPIFEME